MKYYFSLIIRLLIPFIISYNLIKIISFELTKITSLFLLKLINTNTFFIDGFIIFNETYVKLVYSCAAASAYFLLLLLIVFTKDIKLTKRIKIFFIGSLVVFITNIFRIILLIVVLDRFSFNLFNKLHMFFWSIIASTLVAIIWIYLTRKYKIRSIPIYSDLKYLLKKIKIYK